MTYDMMLNTLYSTGQPVRRQAWSVGRFVVIAKVDTWVTYSLPCFRGNMNPETTSTVYRPVRLERTAIIDDNWHPTAEDITADDWEICLSDNVTTFFTHSRQEA